MGSNEVHASNAMLQKYERDVLRFHQAMVLHIGDPSAPGFLNEDEAKLRGRMLNEEIGETINKGIRRGDMIEVIDGLADSLYVTLGTGISLGFDVVPLVHWHEPKVVHDPKAMLSRARYFEEMLIGACRAACAAIDSRNVEATRATHLGMIHVLNATVNAWNIPLEPFWDEVQRANMAKLPPDQPGGKVRKPAGWRGPDHAPIFFRVFGLTEDTGSGPNSLTASGNCPGIVAKPEGGAGAARKGVHW
jgi:predicted HAD superfamily Cof-like phosphohydrolase